MATRGRASTRKSLAAPARVPSPEPRRRSRNSEAPASSVPTASVATPASPRKRARGSKASAAATERLPAPPPPPAPIPVAKVPSRQAHARSKRLVSSDTGSSAVESSTGGETALPGWARPDTPVQVYVSKKAKHDSPAKTTNTGVRTQAPPKDELFLVTGASSFLGSYIVLELLRQVSCWSSARPHTP
jgi:hypothetical protein